LSLLSTLTSPNWLPSSTNFCRNGAHSSGDVLFGVCLRWCPRLFVLGFSINRSHEDQVFAHHGIGGRQRRRGSWFPVDDTRTLHHVLDESVFAKFTTQQTDHQSNVRYARRGRNQIVPIDKDDRRVDIGGIFVKWFWFLLRS